MRRMLLACCASFIVSLCLSQPASTQQKAISLRRVFELQHISPRDVNDSFSHSLFNAVLDATDPDRLIYTAPEYQMLSQYARKLDDELYGKGWEFLNVLSRTYQFALRRADSILIAITKAPVTF